MPDAEGIYRGGEEEDQDDLKENIQTDLDAPNLFRRRWFGVLCRHYALHFRD